MAAAGEEKLLSKYSRVDYLHFLAKPVGTLNRGPSDRHSRCESGPSIFAPPLFSAKLAGVVIDWSYN